MILFFRYIMNYLLLIDDLFLVSKYIQGFHTFPLITFAPASIAEITLFSKCHFTRGVKYFQVKLCCRSRPYYLMFKEAGKKHASFSSDAELKSQFYIQLIFCEICKELYLKFIFDNSGYRKAFFINRCICKNE